MSKQDETIILLPEKLTGMQAVNWLKEHHYLHTNRHNNYEAFNETHILRIDIDTLNLYYYEKDSMLPDKEISHMPLSVGVLFGNLWKIRKRGNKVTTTYNDEQYDITGCSSSRCYACQYRGSVERTDIIDDDGIPSFEQMCIVDKKELIDGNRHTWCITNQKTMG